MIIKFLRSFITTAIILITFSANGFSQVDKDPLQTAKAVADMVIRDSVNEFVLVPQKEILGVQVIDFRNESIETKANYAYSTIINTGNSEAVIGISYDVPVKIWINGNLVFEKNDSPKLYFFEEAYNWIVFQEKITTSLKPGKNEVLVKTVSGAGKGVILLQTIGENKEPDPKYKFTMIDGFPNEKIQKWIYTAGYSAGASSVQLLDHKFAPEDGFEAMYSTKNGEHNWKMHGETLLRKIKIPETAKYQRDSYLEWHYATGATLLGVYEVGTFSGDKKYTDHMNTFADFTLNNYDFYKNQFYDNIALRGSNYRIFRMGMLDDSGGPVLPLVLAYPNNPNKGYKILIDEVEQYVRKVHLRLDDKTFARIEPTMNTVWADDLFMTVPFFVRLAKINNDPSLYDEAAFQVLNLPKRLHNPETGLYYHGWFGTTNEQSVVQWARANGWIAWATSEALLHLPKKHKDYKKIQKQFKAQIDALIKYQDASGMWHQVLDHPESFEETSATAMFILATARGVQNGWVSKKYKENVIRGWNALAKNVDSEGTVKDITRGTGMGFDFEFYYTRDRFENDPRGLGAVMTAGVEVARMLGLKKK